jgi:adenosylcobyric acid synthase
VLPYAHQLWLDAEDSLSAFAHRVIGTPEPPRGEEWLRVGAVRLPRISNSTDVEALACEPGVLVRWISDPADLTDADLVVLPGTKATVADLTWLRDRGLAGAIADHARGGKPVLGICGGFQMLCRCIEDTVESGSGAVDGLGLLDADIVFSADKVLRRWSTPLSGYEIHHGRLVRCAEGSWFDSGPEHCEPQGVMRGAVFGTHWHGLLDNDEFRRAWLTRVAGAAGRNGFVVADDINVAARRDAQLDLIAELLAAHLDVDAFLSLLDGPPPHRPHVAIALGEPAKSSRTQTDRL